MNDPKKPFVAGAPLIELEGVREDWGRLAGPKASIRMRELASRGQVAYVRVIDPSDSGADGAHFVERRIGDRREVRLRSAKLLDMRRRFLCECLVRDRSLTGLRLTLGRDCGVPKKFYLFDDETQELVCVTVAWRRSSTVGVRVFRERRDPENELKVRAIMRGKFYALSD